MFLRSEIVLAERLSHIFDDLEDALVRIRVNHCDSTLVSGHGDGPVVVLLL